MTIEFPAQVSEVSLWILMPPKRPFRSWRVERQTKETALVEALQPATEFLSDNYQILAFRMLDVQPKYRYEITWYYK